MQINLIWDSSVSSAPAGWEAEIESAAQILDRDLLNNISVNISVGYGEIGGQTLSAFQSSGGPNFFSFSYASVQSALVAHDAADSVDFPTSNPAPQYTLGVPEAEAMALGIFTPPNNSTIEGIAGFGSGFSGNELIAAALHELTHALGRITGNSPGNLGGNTWIMPLDYLRFSANGVRSITSGQTGSTFAPAYFSLDGGATNLASFDTASDVSDWTRLPNDPFNWVSSGSVSDTLSRPDLLLMQALGYTISSPKAASSDLNSDGYSDLVWQNADGTAATWLMNSTTVTGGGAIGTNPGSAWQVKGTGDFNGDGDADIVLQNANGTAAVWLMNGAALLGGAVVGSNPGTSWRVMGTGDFDGSGSSDILWQNDSGQAAIWFMNGAATTGGGTAGSNPGPSWHIKGTGDFNADDKSDILWQNNDGTVAIWEMNGTSVIGGGVVGSNPGPSWHVIGTGDFDEDGKSDILFQNDSGQAAIWTMNGQALTGGGLAGPNPGTSWHAIGTGDYNGDGMADILWQNSDGTPAVWLMSGTSLIGGGPMSNPGSGWHLIAGTG